MVKKFAIIDIEEETGSGGRGRIEIQALEFDTRAQAEAALVARRKEQGQREIPSFIKAITPETPTLIVKETREELKERLRRKEEPARRRLQERLARQAQEKAEAGQPISRAEREAARRLTGRDIQPVSETARLQKQITAKKIQRSLIERQKAVVKKEKETAKIEAKRERKVGVTVTTGPSLTEATLDLRPSGAVVGFEARELERREEFTPEGLISVAPTRLKVSTFFTPEKQIQFEKEGIVGKAKSFVSGAGQLIIGAGKTILGEVPGVKKFPGDERKGLSPTQALFTTFFATTGKAKTTFAKEQLAVVGPAIATGVRQRPFALFGQLALTELVIRGARQARVAAIERQPTSVRLGTKGEIITTPSPTKKGTTISVIKPTEFIAESGGTKIAGVGEGRAAATQAGDVVAGFKFRTRAAKTAPTTTVVATKGKIIQPTPDTSRGAFISEIQTTTARGKVTKQKGISLTESERIVGGNFPLFRTGGLELREGTLRVIPTRESFFRIGRAPEPKFVRVGLTKKEADISTPFFTGEQFTFLEKGVSVRKFEQVAKKRKKEIKRILKPGETTAPVFQVGGLVPPVAVPKPTPKVTTKPAPIIAGEFLKGIRGVVKAERISAIPKVKIAAFTGTKSIAGTGQIQRQVPKIKSAIKSAVKPITETVPKADSKVGQIAALKPTVIVGQRTGQRTATATRQVLRTGTRFTPTPKPTPIPVPVGGGAFVLPIPRRGLPTPIKPKKVKEKKRKFRGTPSLSVVLGGTGTQLTRGQLTGKETISPLLIRQIGPLQRIKRFT